MHTKSGTLICQQKICKINQSNKTKTDKQNRQNIIRQK